jgi:SAM-dependent methyltransferase
MGETKGWFRLPGVSNGAARTIAEQMLGLEEALSVCSGKTVLDLGCAEAAISREFAKAGAARVVGIETAEWSVDLARKVCAEFPQVEIIHANLHDYMQEHPIPERFDIVLALGIIHKMSDMAAALRWSARASGDYYLLRPPGYVEPDGWFRNKKRSDRVHAPTVLHMECFTEQRRFDSAHGEHVEYWRRISPS